MLFKDQLNIKGIYQGLTLLMAAHDGGARGRGGGERGEGRGASGGTRRSHPGTAALKSQPPPAQNLLGNLSPECVLIGKYQFVAIQSLPKKKGINCDKLPISQKFRRKARRGQNVPFLTHSK